MLCQFLLYNKVNQLYVYIYPHIPSVLRLIPTLPIPPLQVVTKHRADLPVRCSCFPLATYFTFGSVCMSMLLSHFVPAYPSPSPGPQVHSLCLHLYSKLGDGTQFFISLLFFKLYIYVYMCVWVYTYIHIHYACMSMYYILFIFDLFQQSKKNISPIITHHKKKPTLLFFRYLTKFDLR